MPGLRTTGLALLALYCCLLGWFALHRVPMPWVYDANLTPFASVHRALAIGGLAGLRQLAGGLLATAPLGVLLPLAGGRLRSAWLPSFLQVIGATAVIATALEFLRTWLAGHVLNVDDILLGVISAGFVHLTMVPAGRSVLRGRLPHRAAPTLRPPGVAERRGAEDRRTVGARCAAGARRLRREAWARLCHTGWLRRARGPRSARPSGPGQPTGTGQRTAGPVRPGAAPRPLSLAKADRA